MTAPDTAPPADGVTPDATDEPKPVTAEDVARLQKALDAERDARKAAEKAAREHEQTRRAAMKDDERALLEAEERGRAAERSIYGQRLAQAEFRTLAAARNPGYDVGKALAYLNVASFVGDDGEPNVKAITAAVNDLIPEASSGPTPPPSFDGGTRATPPPRVDMSAWIRKGAGRA